MTAGEGHDAGMLERFHLLDKSVAEGFAEMRGKIDTMVASKDGVHARLDERIDDAQTLARGAETKADAAHQRIDLYPKPESVEAAITKGEATSIRLDRMIYFMLGSGMLGGGLAAAIVTALTN